MKRKLLIIIVLLIGLFTITGCEQKEKTDADIFKEEYESINNQTIDKHKAREVTIDKENPMVYKSAKEIVDMIDDNKTFIVFFGYNDCPWTRSMVETLIEVSNDYSIGEIYYVDIKRIRDTRYVDKEGNIKTKNEGSKYYYELLNRLDNLLEEYKIDDVSMEEKRIESPSVIAITNGKPLEMTSGISDDQKDPYQKITKKMKNNMYKKMECLAKCVNEASTTCKKNTC